MLAVWWGVCGLPETEWPESGRWKAQSPTLGKVIEYNEREVWAEVERIREEAVEQGWPLGHALFSQLPFFASPDWFLEPDVLRWMKDLRLIRATHTPAAVSLDDMSNAFAEAVILIEQEEAAAMKHAREKHGNQK